ncbi:hypothetical protein IT418_01540 [bacterium]|nr:hypothetical protein [bacterium]
MQEFRDWVKEKVVIEGLVSVYKPYGIPSTSLTEMYKRITGEKVGHGGTLDPLAEGAMLLGISKGTKLLTNYLESEKRYVAGILIGAKSDAGDLELPLTPSLEALNYSDDKIVTIFEKFAKGYTQELPLLNSTKQKGKKAYMLVREGKPTGKRYVETRLIEWNILQQEEMTSSALQERIKTTIQNLETAYEQFYAIGDLVGYSSRKYSFLLEKWKLSLAQSIQRIAEFPNKKYLFLYIDVKVPKGTYIRALAQDIARELNSDGVLLSLERSNAGNR